jgi:parvulin-like peptidyl-prolyl isomerase
MATGAWAESPKVLGEGGGIKVTDVEAEVFRDMFVPPKLVLPQRELLRAVLEQKLFAREALKEGLDREPELRTRLEVVRERELATAYVTKHLFQELGITEDVLKSYYLSHIDDYTSPDKYTLARIVLKSREEADKVRKMLTDGQEFGDLVEKYSLDYLTWKSKGVFGSYALKGLNPRVAGAVKDGKKGDITDVVELKNGFFYIFKIIDIVPGEVTPFKEVRDKIMPVVVGEKKLEVKRKMQERLMKEYGFSWKTGVLTDRPTAPLDEEK